SPSTALATLFAPPSVPRSVAVGEALVGVIAPNRSRSIDRRARRTVRPVNEVIGRDRRPALLVPQRRARDSFSVVVISCPSFRPTRRASNTGLAFPRIMKRASTGAELGALYE